MIDFLKKNVERTKVLLDSKGFSCEPREIAKKIVLIHTEMSELADAVKKGLDTEPEEVADIAIRIFNLPLVFEKEYNSMINSMDQESMDNLLKSQEGKEVFRLKENNADVCEQKYEDIYHITRSFNKEIGHFAEEIYSATNAMYIQEGVIKNFIDSIIFSLCRLELYLRKYHPDTNLQKEIDKKQDINFKRPYKFNTYEEKNDDI